jgi:hypothetical protein
MVRDHQPGESVFRTILPENLDWQPFPAFPPAVTDATKQCFECHQARKEQDYVYSTYIP